MKHETTRHTRSGSRGAAQPEIGALEPLGALEILEASPQGLLLIDDAGCVSYANEAAERVLGEPMSGQSAWDVFPQRAAGRSSFREALLRVSAGGGSETFEVDQPPWAVPCRVSLRRSRDGTVAYLTDISAQRRAEESERAARQQAAMHEARMHTLFEQSPFPMALYGGPDHVVLLSNAAHARSAGRAITPGMRHADVFPELRAEGFHEILDRVYATGEPFVSPAQVLRLRDETGALVDRYFHITYQPIASMSGGLPSMFMIAFEVTSLVQMSLEIEDGATRERLARSEAEAASRTKDEFLAVLSHELRTPLNAILGWSVVLQNTAPEPASMQRALRTIERNARQQANLIDDVLDVARITSGKLTLRLVEVGLGPMIADALESMRPIADAKGVTLASDLEELPAIIGDDSRLQQVVRNLLGNAIKFTPRDGRVEVRAAADDELVTLTVSDTGIGVSEHFIEHVFDRFRQADGSMTRAHGGLGLGLAIVKHLVESHGGTVHAESAGLGLGATFSVRLPRAQRRGPISTMPPPSSPELALEAVRVLIVDDDADTRELVAAVCREAGGEVRVADSALAARAIFRAWPVGVVVSDLGMPDESGCDLMRWLRESEWAATPAISLSGYAGDDHARRAAEVGFDAHLTKPLDPRRFVSELVRLRRAR